eukprot:4904594-Prymnesium_polylepis.1
MGDNDPSMLDFGAGATHGSVRTRLSGAPAEAARPVACQDCYVAALGRMIACYLMRARYIRCMNALGPRVERVSTVN